MKKTAKVGKFATQSVSDANVTEKPLTCRLRLVKANYIVGVG